MDFSLPADLVAYLDELDQFIAREIKPIEATCDFKNGRLAATSISLYNRGDSKEKMSTAGDFEKQVEGYKRILSARLGVKSVERGKDASSVVGATGFMWSKPPTAFLLEYSFQKEVKAASKDRGVGRNGLALDSHTADAAILAHDLLRRGRVA